MTTAALEDMANANLHGMHFPGLDLEDDVPDHPVLSRFRTCLAAAQAWDGLPTDQPANTGAPDNSNERLSH